MKDQPLIDSYMPRIYPAPRRRFPRPYAPPKVQVSA
jgi:hypothetical protein